MEKKIFLSFILVISLSNFCCKKTNTGSDNTSQKGNVGFDNRDATSLPIKIYIDGELKATIGNPMPVYQTCGNSYAHIILQVEKGSHKFALVDSYGYYADGTFSVNGNGCTNIPFYAANFDRINYGTNNGSFTIVSSILNANTINVWIDNNFIGKISHTAGYFICGHSEDGYVISQQLSPGTHSFKAVEEGTGKTWTGTKTIQTNVAPI